MMPPATAMAPQPRKPAHPRRKPKAPKARYAGLHMSADEFFDWEPDAPDAWKYEWSDGVLVANEQAMKPNERLAVMNLMRAFSKTRHAKGGGQLLQETLIPVAGGSRVRIPDLSFFTREEAVRSLTDKAVVPSFVIELISPTDSAMHHEQKLVDYFTAGVQCVWHVYPDFKAVRVFSTPRLAERFTGTEVFSAAPALPEFQMTVEELFATTAQGE